MPITRQDVNEDITAKITGKTIAKSITPTEDGANRVLMMDYVDQQVIAAIYAATLSQSGTSAPVNTSTKNNTGLSFSWSRTSVGEYILTCSTSLNAFTCIPYVSIGAFALNSFTIIKIGDTFRIRTYDNGVLSDGLLNSCALKIEFYP